MRAKFLSGVVVAGCLVVMVLISYTHRTLTDMYEEAHAFNTMELSLVIRLLLNLFGYGAVLVPGFILYKYIERTNYFEHHTVSNVPSRVLYAMFGSYERLAEAGPTAGKPAGSVAGAGEGRRELLELAFCFTGLMAAYLVWGLLQEKIMTQSYLMPDGSLVRFTDSQFLVLINRLAALCIAAVRLRATRRPLVAAPLYKFSYCALSNVVSAWCQYEALKYVSFPTQVLSKSCKVLPVMLMGIVVSRNKYHTYEYVTAALISLGMAAFMLGSHTHNEPWVSSTASGALLLALYMCCDAFTASWQSRLFAQYRLSPLQMLCAVNVCSCLLLHRAASLRHLAMLQHGGFVVDVVVLSASSALGQLLIYRTIARFGAVVFTIIMTLRQAVSILLSCIVYGHPVSASGACGIVVVFVAVLLRVYCAQRMRRKQQLHAHKHAPTLT